MSSTSYGSPLSISEGVVILANNSSNETLFNVIGKVKIQINYNFSKSNFILKISEGIKNFYIFKSFFKQKSHAFHFLIKF